MLLIHLADLAIKASLRLIICNKNETVIKKLEKVSFLNDFSRMVEFGDFNPEGCVINS